MHVSKQVFYRDDHDADKQSSLAGMIDIDILKHAKSMVVSFCSNGRSSGL